MPKDNSQLNLMNASGFAFQLAVEDSIPVGPSWPNCEILAREHPWKNKFTGREGFIDIIVKKGIFRFVIECKRSKNAYWQFLMVESPDMPKFGAHIMWTLPFSETEKAAQWDEVRLVPSSPESQFCTVRGSGEGQVSMLDKIGSFVVEATEALAYEELAYKKTYIENAYVYVPVIVTNAELEIGSFKTSEFDLKSGEVNEAKYNSISHIRYRKALTVHDEETGPAVISIRESNRQSQRTVFVVNSTELSNWLLEFDTGPKDPFRELPWDLAQRLYRMDKE